MIWSECRYLAKVRPHTSPAEASFGLCGLFCLAHTQVPSWCCLTNLFTQVDLD